ncbi:unnamed protein product [Urochloa humidicola]
MGYSMAAATVKGSLQGPAGCASTFLSARKPRIANFARFPGNHPLQQRGRGDRWGGRLKVQEPDRVPRSRKPLFSDADYVDPQAPTSYVDVLNTLRILHPSVPF